MITIYKTVDGVLTTLDTPETDCWINLTNPTEVEVQDVAVELGIPPDFLIDPLDLDERARMEVEDENILIVIRAPMKNPNDAKVPYVTLPIGIVITPSGVVTICRSCANILDPFVAGKVRSFATRERHRFAIQILQRVALIYLVYLKDLNKQTSQVEQELHKSMRNEELIDLLSIEKSLVYFITSLKANDIIMEKLLRSRLFKLKEDEADLLEDALTESKQAIDMTKIHADILSGTMDAFASIISNNMNMVMKFLTSVTILLMIPNIISGIYGMNIQMPFQDSPHAFVIVSVSSIILSILAVGLFIKKRWL